jgi:hypothetical protein
MKKLFFGWTNIKHVVRQIYLTFTKDKSELMSKKIERALFVITALSVVVSTTIYLIKSNKMDALEATILYSPLLVAAGYNIAMGSKETKAKTIADELK